MTPIRFAWFSLPLLLLLSGCASTPEKRIEQNQSYFDSLPVAAQARIRGGQIDLGFNPDMVRLALGEPQRQLVRRTPEGDTDIWAYLETDTRYERQHVDIDGLNVYGAGGVRSTSGGAWVTILQEKQFVRTRVEFKDGRVSLIEEIAPEEPKK
jgi:hypothetical protein